MEIEDNISASGSWLLSVWGSFCPVVSNTWPSSPKMFALLHAHGSLLHQCQSSCLVLLGKDSRSPLSITRTTYFVSFEPVCHVSLNTIIEALLFGWHKRGLFFSMWFECFVCISKSEPFCLFFPCVRLKSEICLHERIVLMHSEECELLFGSDVENFAERLLVGRTNCRTAVIKNTPAEAEIFIYTI